MEHLLLAVLKNMIFKVNFNPFKHSGLNLYFIHKRTVISQDLTRNENPIFLPTNSQKHLKKIIIYEIRSK